MNGLEQIVSINKTEQARREDAVRASRGLKPKTALAASLRAASRSPVKTRTLARVPQTQGR